MMKKDMEMEDMEMDSETEKEESKYGKFEEYEIKCAADAVREVEELKNNPEKLKYVKEYMKHEADVLTKSLGSISSIADLKQVRNKKFGKKEEE
jgi:hypothetical protein